jgi:hypothetical protein
MDLVIIMTMQESVIIFLRIFYQFGGFRSCIPIQRARREMGDWEAWPILLDGVYIVTLVVKGDHCCRVQARFLGKKLISSFLVIIWMYIQRYLIMY